MRAEGVADLIDVLGLNQRRRIHAQREVVESDVFDAFGRELERNDSVGRGGRGAGENPCEASDGPTPPLGWPTELALRM